jgi:SAM-dependent methyltransferase
MSPPEDRVYTAEAATQAGKIDILATDSKHTLVVIELKANIASYSTLGQILSYMASIKEELGKDSEAKEDGDHPMSSSNPIDLLFGDMEKLGPGSNFDTLKMLGMLPKAPYQVIVDAGCGAGRHTLALANELQTLVHAIDSYEPFLASLTQHAKEVGIEHLVQTHCMDMADIPGVFPEIDLLWSEGAAYSIGFPHALKTWHSAIKSSGFAVVSELSWLRDQVPVEARMFFQSGYADMRSVDQNRAVVEGTGYKVLATHTTQRDMGGRLL